MKTSKIEIRCTPEQKETIKQKADALGLSVSQYMLMVAITDKFEVRL